MKRTKATKRVTIRLPLGLAERLATAAVEAEQYESEYIRDVLRRDLLQRQEPSEGRP